jgi:hypothetical protein
MYSLSESLLIMKAFPKAPSNLLQSSNAFKKQSTNILLKKENKRLKFQTPQTLPSSIIESTNSPLISHAQLHPSNMFAINFSPTAIVDL